MLDDRQSKMECNISHLPLEHGRGNNMIASQSSSSDADYGQQVTRSRFSRSSCCGSFLGLSCCCSFSVMVCHGKVNEGILPAELARSRQQQRKLVHWHTLQPCHNVTPLRQIPINRGRYDKAMASNAELGCSCVKQHAEHEARSPAIRVAFVLCSSAQPLLMKLNARANE